MKNFRIIPRLDIKGPNVVKGIHLEGLRVLGRPAEFAKFYYESGADELLFMDVVASLYERNSLNEIISETAKNMFIPLTVGGGIRSLDDIRNVLRCGADKVCLNTACIKNPNIITEASRKFGSSTIVVAIEAIRENNGKYLAYTDNGREYTGKDVNAWAKEVQDLGAGEIIITSVDKEGTGEGFDIELVSSITKVVDIPVIAHGGAGKKQDISEIILKSDVDAVSLSSLLHYNYIKKHVSKSENNEEGNFEFLNSKRDFHTFQTCDIKELKEFLLVNNISCRI